MVREKTTKERAMEKKLAESKQNHQRQSDGLFTDLEVYMRIIEPTFRDIPSKDYHSNVRFMRRAEITMVMNG